MSAWIGPLGNLIEFKCPSAVESSSEDPHVYFRPLGGDVATTTLGGGTRPRVWDVRVSTAHPAAVAALESLADGQFGPGPFVFVPPGAETVNLLGKRDALSMGTPWSTFVADRPGAIVINTTEGPSGAGYAAQGDTPGTTGLGDAPVIPGLPVTGKAWTQPLVGTTATLQLRFRDADANTVGWSPVVSTTDSTGTFLHSTATAPAGAAYATLVASAALITRPSITWTPEPRTWAPSKASSNVVVSPLSAVAVRATGQINAEQINDHAFTVTELRA